MSSSRALECPNVSAGFDYLSLRASETVPLRLMGLYPPSGRCDARTPRESAWSDCVPSPPALTGDFLKGMIHAPWLIVPLEFFDEVWERMNEEASGRMQAMKARSLQSRRKVVRRRRLVLGIVAGLLILAVAEPWR